LYYDGYFPTMSYLVVGPSSSGKSTYIKKLIEKKKINPINLIFGIQFKTKFFDKVIFWKKKVKIKKNSIVHLNIIDHIFFYNKEICFYDLFKKHKIFNKLLKDINLFDEILILYTPIDELILRVKNRSHVEIGDNLKYNRKYFVKLYTKINFYYVYNNLFNILDTRSIKYKILFSSQGKFKFDKKNKAINSLNNYYKYKNNISNTNSKKVR